MRKLVILVAFIAIAMMAFADDSYRCHYYYGPGDSGTDPLMMPDGVTPLQGDCMWELVLCVDQAAGTQDYINDYRPQSLNLDSGNEVTSYFDTVFNTSMQEAGFFQGSAYQIFSDPEGQPGEPNLTCGDKYYIRLYNTGSRETATYYRTCTTQTGPAINVSEDYPLTTWNDWVALSSPNPTVATDPAPTNAATDVAIDANLGWNYTSDPAFTDPVQFKLYLNTSDDFTGIAPVTVTYTAGTVGYSYTPAVNFEYDTMYYWKVVPTTNVTRNATRATAKRQASRGDAEGCVTWSFTTESAPVANYPTVATTPAPANGAVDVALTTATLEWEYIVDPAFSDPTGFKVYFNDANDFAGIVPVEVPYVEGQVAYTTAMPALAYTSHYYWKVVPFNALRSGNTTRSASKNAVRGEAIGCPVWDFQTVVGNINPGQPGGTDFDLGGGTVVTFDPGDGNPAGQIDITVPPTPDPISYSSFNTGTNNFGGTNLFFHIDGHGWDSWPVELTFTWNAPVPTYDIPAIWYNENAGAGWQQLDVANIIGSNLTVAPYWIKVSVNHFSDWTPGWGSTVPVEFGTFTAVYAANSDQVNLTWTTSTETDMQGYRVLRADGSNARQYISGIQGAYNTSETHMYTFSDTDVSAGKTYTYWVEAIELNGYTTYHQSAPVTIVPNTVVPYDQMTGLGEAYPNPFNPTTTIKFSVKEGDHASIVIYNMLGQVVKNFGPQEATKNGGKITWNGMDDNNRPVCSGIYFFKMKSNSTVSVKKVMLMK
jgi:hypothetical protein